MKRFWKDVSVTSESGGHGVALDGKPIRTPGRVPLAVPSVALADAIAAEWRSVGDTVDPRRMGRHAELAPSRDTRNPRPS